MPSKINKKTGGFVILYAVIVAMVVSVVGISLMNIITKQLVLSSISRNAKISYYAALAGRDCAEFWYENQNSQNQTGESYFGGYVSDDETSEVVWKNPANLVEISCVGDISDNPISYEPDIQASRKVVSEFQFSWNINNQQVCSHVTVETNSDCPISIFSEGYNASCEQADSGDYNFRLVKSTYKSDCGDGEEQ